MSLIVILWLGSCSWGKLEPDLNPATPSPTLPGLSLEQLENVQLADRHLASDSSFSLQPPLGWQTKTVTGLTYATFVQDIQNIQNIQDVEAANNQHDAPGDQPEPSNTIDQPAQPEQNQPEGDRYQANISIFSDTYDGALDDYANVNINSVSKAFQNFQILSQSDFITNSGLAGIVIVSQSEQLGNQLQQWFYIFDAPANRKLVITCSVLANDADRLAPIFAASIKTLQIESTE
ncbi:DUF1795 domain-containing protein [Thalassoporum mexicanum]|uniref:DUF1795 domain-containing protein n=1 Tax=Thalassoporum mexicanum TaxID=3457544 RepID=UPI0012EA1802|nr:DUF1795 domain-containing protein [Pseudanabaena sp. PCC 7367]